MAAQTGVVDAQSFSFLGARRLTFFEFGAHFVKGQSGIGQLVIARNRQALSALPTTDGTAGVTQGG